MRRLYLPCLLGLILACSSRPTPNDGDDGAAATDEGESGSTSADATASDSAGTSDTGSEACMDFATGSLSDGSEVPAQIDTALGVTLEFEALIGDGVNQVLEMAFVCSSNGQVLESGKVGANANTAFEVEVESQDYEVSFAWTPVVQDLEFSVAVKEI